MSNKNAKKTPAAKSTVENPSTIGGIKVVEKAPTLAEIVSGKGEAVSKAVAEKAAKLAVIPAPAKATAKKAEKAPAKKAAAKKGEKAETVASFMRRLIGEGKSNEEVFAAAQKSYGIGEEKKHYPSWYRCEMKRKAAAEKPAAKTPAAKKGKELPQVKKVPTKKTAKA